MSSLRLFITRHATTEGATTESATTEGATTESVTTEALYVILIVLLSLLMSMSGHVVEAGAEEGGEEGGGWYSLRYSRTTTYVAPGRHHPVAFYYQRESLPVFVDKEVRGWSRITDFQGESSWIDSHHLSTRRMVQILAEQVSVYAKAPQPDRKTHKTHVILKRHVLARLAHCEETHCLVSGKNFHGWVAKIALFGVD